MAASHHDATLTGGNIEHHISGRNLPTRNRANINGTGMGASSLAVALASH